MVQARRRRHLVLGSFQPRLPGMVYDIARDKTVLFGGSYNNTTMYNEVWSGTGAGGEGVPHRHVRHDADGEILSRGRLRPQPVGDDRVRRMTVYAGTSSSETWEWNGVTKTWTLVCPTGSCTTYPSARNSAAMVYHAATSKFILVGGSVGGDETWELYWNGTRWQWNRICPGATCSAARSRTGATPWPMIRRARGSCSTAGTRRGTRTWSCTGAAACGSGQRRAAAARARPGDLTLPGMVYDSSRGKVVMSGGFQSTSSMDTTWEWDGATWTKICGSGTSCGGHVAVG